jgi:hypothetical protein
LAEDEFNNDRNEQDDGGKRISPGVRTGIFCLGRKRRRLLTLIRRKNPDWSENKAKCSTLCENCWDRQFSSDR